MLVNEICARALHLAGTLGVGEEASSEDMNAAVDTLNDMLFAWALDGLDLGHSEVTAADTLYVDSAYIRAIRYSLAIELSIEHGTQLMPGVSQGAEMERDRVRTALSDINVLACDNAVIGSRAVFNPITGQ